MLTRTTIVQPPVCSHDAPDCSNAPTTEYETMFLVPPKARLASSTKKPAEKEIKRWQKRWQGSLQSAGLLTARRCPDVGKCATLTSQFSQSDDVISNRSASTFDVRQDRYVTAANNDVSFSSDVTSSSSSAVSSSVMTSDGGMTSADDELSQVCLSTARWLYCP